jgi:DNA-binding CsgD family transcriptional regulator
VIPDDHRLLTALYQGVFEQPLWVSFLDHLRARTGALYVNLMFRPPGEERTIELFSGSPPGRELAALLSGKFARTTLSHRRMREGRVYAREELLEGADHMQRSLVDEVLIPWGLTHSRTMRVAEPSGFDAWLSCSGGRGINWASVSTLMAGLAPDLGIVLRTFSALERENFRSEVTAEALRRRDFGWMTLDSRCRILDMSPHIKQLMQRSNVLRRGRYDRLSPADPAVDRELTALVRAFANDPAAPARAVNLSRDPQIDMLVSPLHSRTLSAAALPVATVYVAGDRWSQADRCGQLMELFGFTNSEARFAWAIAQGSSIAEAAGELGLTIETARYYSKQVYAKTGSRGQADLVRMILVSVTALA